MRFAASSELRSVCDRRSTVKEASRVAWLAAARPERASA